MFRIKKNVLLVGLSLLLSLTAVFSFYHLLPVFLMGYGFEEKSLGYLYTFFLFTYNFGQLIGGIFLKRISARDLYATSTLLVAVLFLALYFPLSRIMVVVVLFFIYLLWGIQLPPQGVIVHDAEKDSARAFSQIEFFALFGILMGPFLGYALLKYISLRAVLLVAGVLEIFVTALRWYVKKEDTASFEGLKFPGPNRRIVLITIFVSLAFFVFYSTSDGPFIPAIMKNVLNLDLRGISLVFGVATFVSIACIPLFYISSVKFGMWRVMGLSVILHGLLVWLWSMHYPALFLLIIAFVSVQPVYTYFMPLLMDNVSLSERGGVLGVVGFISGTIGSLSPMLLAHSKNPFLYTFVVSIFAGALVLLFPLKKQGFQEGGI